MIILAGINILLAAMVYSVSESTLFIFWPLAVTGLVEVEFVFLLDIISLVFLFTVVLISTAVFIFRTSYICHEKFFLRFKILLLAFVFSILALILCPNLISILLGWDGLGVTSYLLVIYYNRSKSFNAGIVTAMTNRLGDVLIIIAAGLLLTQGTWVTKIRGSEFFDSQMVQALLIVGCFTKRAQIPFRSWLPAAMAAPTPVSSLVHSSTLVTAGVYVLIRHTEGLTYFFSEDWVLISGLATMIIASLSALGERDIKKMVALSTLSQLGIIVTRLGISCSLIAFIHLVIHAFFKAIIFISTGNAIHHRKRYQACRKTGFLSQSRPINTSSLIRGAIRLVGAPFAAAFFSKEPILENLFIHDRLLEISLILSGVFLTILYTFRFTYFVLRTTTKIESRLIVLENDFYANTSILILFLPSFSRGVCIIHMVQRLRVVKPLSPEWIKLLVLLALGAGLVDGVNKLSTKLRGFPQHDFLCIWSLPNFSRSLFNFHSYSSGKTVSSTNFGWRLTIIMSINLSQREKSIAYLLENNYLYRIILFIPLSLVVLSILIN